MNQATCAGNSGFKPLWFFNAMQRQRLVAWSLPHGCSPWPTLHPCRVAMSTHKTPAYLPACLRLTFHGISNHLSFQSLYLSTVLRVTHIIPACSLHLPTCSLGLTWLGAYLCMLTCSEAQENAGSLSCLLSLSACSLGRTWLGSYLCMLACSEAQENRGSLSCWATCLPALYLFAAWVGPGRAHLPSERPADS
jgi:hypothetical protein